MFPWFFGHWEDRRERKKEMLRFEKYQQLRVLSKSGEKWFSLFLI
jgi:hypothetical protein